MKRLTSLVIGTVSILLLSWVATRCGANAVTAGLIYLVAVLLLAAWRGFLSGAAGSLAATFSFNYFFLTPIGTFHIDEQANWVALVCFLIASLVASQLVLRAQNRAADADARRNEVLMLYDLCVDLFAASGGAGSLDGAVRRALASLGARSGGFLVQQDERDAGETSWFGSAGDLEMHKLLVRDAAPVTERGSKPWRNVSIPVTIGSNTHGTLVVYGTRADPAAVESVAKLVGLAVERETLIRERAEVEALQASDEFKTAVLRAVSHDLSTPLTAMALQVAKLRRTLRPEDVRAVDALDEEMHRLRRRIENLLAMARLESGQLGVRREPTPPADLFRVAREHLQLVCAARPVTADVEEDCPDLDVDPSLAAEILVNLIENAHRASPGSAAIELQASLADRGMVRLDVLDRGSGLAAGGPSETSDTPRFGLGLQIARAFAQASGGTLSLKSRAGGGARASVLLPSVASVGRSRGEQFMTLILVVDDDPAIRTALAEEIGSGGDEVITAGGANTALALVDERRPDLIVTDLSMPGGDGFSLIAAVRKVRATPIIVISVRGREQDKVRALDLGADDYVVKPFSIAEVLARVRAQLRRSGMSSTGVLQFTDLTIDLDRRRVVQGGRDIRLTPTELSILQLLAANCGKPLTFARIIASVWPGMSATTPDTVRVHIGSIRRKIEPDSSSPRYIVTEPWVGYRFIGEPV